LGRRRRKRIKKVVRRSTLMSRYFICPICGQRTLTIDFKKSNKPGTKLAIVRCGNCKLYLNMEVPEVLDKIDVYNKVVDLVHEGKIEQYMKPSSVEGVGENEEQSTKVANGEEGER